MKITEQYLKDLPENESHILVCQTPIVLPFSFIVHTFILTKYHGEINRYEVFGLKSDFVAEHGCVFKNDLEPWEGMLYIFMGDIRRKGRKRFGSKLIKHFNSNTTKNITALISKIESSYLAYPYRFDYSYKGANSNTFTRWLLREVGLEVQLPWNAIGKNHKLD